MLYDCRGITEGFFLRSFSNEQEFCIIESLFCEKTFGGDFAGKSVDAGLGGVLWKQITIHPLHIIV